MANYKNLDFDSWIATQRLIGKYIMNSQHYKYWGKYTEPRKSTRVRTKYWAIKVDNDWRKNATLRDVKILIENLQKKFPAICFSYNEGFHRGNDIYNIISWPKENEFLPKNTNKKCSDLDEYYLDIKSGDEKVYSREEFVQKYPYVEIPTDKNMVFGNGYFQKITIFKTPRTFHMTITDNMKIKIEKFLTDNQISYNVNI